MLRPSKCITDNGPIRGGRTIFPELRALGARVWSGSLSWAEAAPTRPANATSPADPAYRWPASLDRVLSAARANGIEPVLNVSGFPAWSNGGRSQEWAPTQPQDFADFMAAAVRKYPQVRRWIIISEPGSFYNFLPQGGNGRTAPHLYASLLDAAYGAMHAVRPDVIVIGGGVHPYGLNDQHTTAPDTFITNMVLPNGRPAAARHVRDQPLHGAPARPQRSRSGRCASTSTISTGWRAALTASGPAATCGSSSMSSAGTRSTKRLVGCITYRRKKQAADLRKAYTLASKFGRIDTMCWFLLYDSPPRPQQRAVAQLDDWTEDLERRPQTSVEGVRPRPLGPAERRRRKSVGGERGVASLLTATRRDERRRTSGYSFEPRGSSKSSSTADDATPRSSGRTCASRRRRSSRRRSRRSSSACSRTRPATARRRTTTRPAQRQIDDLQQMFVVQRGVVDVELFTDDGTTVREVRLGRR